ncbi:hypothetical protein CLOM_g551 [Closterium sp. NIES-68]|nr:hypothetical protein CLOM_g551 [Closterium sp. NIES-68]GJP69158.1 hypothetical protein CLOP_g115 [Closterium sp. NIES-67]
MAPFAAEFAAPSHDFVVRTLSPRSPSCRVSLREALQREAAGAVVAGEPTTNTSSSIGTSSATSSAIVPGAANADVDESRWLTNDVWTVADDRRRVESGSSPSSSSSLSSSSVETDVTLTSSLRDGDWALIDDSFCMDLLFDSASGGVDTAQSAESEYSRREVARANGQSQSRLGSSRNVAESVEVNQQAKENDLCVGPGPSPESATPSSSALFLDGLSDGLSSLLGTFPRIPRSDETLSRSHAVIHPHGLDAALAVNRTHGSSEIGELERAEQRGIPVTNASYSAAGSDIDKGSRLDGGGGREGEVSVQDGRVHNQIVDESRLGEVGVEEKAVFLSEFEARAPFVEFTLSDDAVRVASSPNAGGASIISESLSVEYFVRHFGASDIISEMEVQYCDSNWKKVDYICSLFGQRFGVSVTRAMMYPNPTLFDCHRAKALLRKKLHGLVVAWSGISPMHCFSRAILHIWCETPEIATLLYQAVPSVCRELELQEDVLIVLTVAEGTHGWPIFYESLFNRHSLMAQSLAWTDPSQMDQNSLCNWVHMDKKHQCTS